MPPPRRPSPRRKERRSRSRSYSPKSSHKKKRSRSRERRSRSPRERKRSRSPHGQRSHDRRRSQTPDRSSPRRKPSGTKRRSASPRDYVQPIKRQADSTRRTYRSKSRSRSPVPTKKYRDSHRDNSPEDRGYSRRRSPSPEYGGKMYADQQSSSASVSRRVSRRTDEIDMVKIVDIGKKKMPKLDKRFQTLEQLAQGSFDFEENITIGIHRGPHHLDLDEDVPVNYDFNPKTFIMLYPKKDYTMPIFDRDEIKAFHHDDILDEEAYVEKRTITVKPTDKPRPSTSSGSSSRYKEMDYKITIGTDRGSYGDRRMVHDSKGRSSRHDPEVKIRLDPKPDPKYERLYKEQQRLEDRDLMDDKIHRNPSDLRYNLMRKKSSDGDRDRSRDRDRDRDRGGRDSSQLDARSRIDAKRKGMSSLDRGPRDPSPPPTRFEKRKIGIKTELPDFKNRPDATKNAKFSTRVPISNRWGFCEICDVPLNSEKQAVEHIKGTQHLEKEKHRDEVDSPGKDREPTTLYINGRRVLDEDEDVKPAIRNPFRHTSPYDEDKFQYEEWEANPEVIPKGASYYEHDNRSRDDMNYWERKQLFKETGKSFGRGAFRGRGEFRGRGAPRGRGRIARNVVVRPQTGLRKIRTPMMDDWKHDKFDEVKTDNQSPEKDRDLDSRKIIERKGNKKEERTDRKRDGPHYSIRSDRTINEEEDALNKDSNISVTAE